jgi:hypothetical protein
LAYLGSLRHLHARDEIGGLLMTLYIDTRPTLDWVEYNGRFMADGYEVHQERSNGKWYWSYYDMAMDTAYYDSMELAKQAAQDDYKASMDDRFRKVEVLPEDVTLHDLKRLRNYFGENDKTLFEHRAYAWLDSLIKHIAKATLPESLHTKP